MTDAFDISTAQIVNAPDVRNWPATAAMTQIRFDGSVSRFAFTKQDGPDRWPDVRPKGWDGDLQYTVWLFRKLDGTWVGSAFIQFWHGRDGSGQPGDPDVPSKYDKNWYYADRWAPLHGSGPIQPGEAIGFMVTSGNQRNSDGPNSMLERSNIVVVPASDNATFAFPSEATPDPPVPPVDPPAPDVPYGDIQDVLKELREIKAMLASEATFSLLDELNDFIHERMATKQDIAEARNDVSAAVKQFGPLLARLLKLFGGREKPASKKAKA